MNPEVATQDLDTVNSRRDGLRFRPRARIMTTLGLELINSDTVALAELVKNSFDADARHVLVAITGEVTEEGLIRADTGTINILDDGHGMNESTIKSTWLEPATGFRRRSTFTPGGRRVLGEKGVGRFAAAKLGTSLELTSKTKEDEEVQLKIDWSTFDTDDKYLDEVQFALRVADKGVFGRTGSVSKMWQTNINEYLNFKEKLALDHGNLLTITGLYNPWTPKDVEDIHRALSRLVSPFQDKHIVTEFNIILNLPESFDVDSGLIERPDVFQKPHYKLGAEVDEDGHATVLIELRDEPERIVNKIIHNQDQKNLRCGPFEIFLNVWDRDSESLRSLASDSGSTKIVRDALDSAAGISIYRDGFRVLPFGERGDDWLNLDHRRIQNPTLSLSNNQIIGYVLICRDQNPELIDQTNRQGIIGGPAFSDLRDAVLELLRLLEKERYKIRPRQERKSKGGLFDRIDLSELQSAVASSVPSESNIPKMVDDIQKKIDDRLENVGEVLSRYHRLATLGQLIDQVVHELAQPIVAIRQASTLGTESIDRSLKRNTVAASSRILDKLKGYYTKIDGQARVANDVVRRVAPFGGRRRGRPQKYMIETAIKDIVALLRENIKSINAEVRLPSTNHEVSLDGSEIQQVLLNLLTNSLYWLKQVRKDSRIISIEVERNNDKSLSLVVEDSGPGVSEGDHDRIFDPYFSTKPNGVGLGLSIAGEIVEDYYGGTLELLSPGRLGGARLRATLKKRVA